MLSCGAGRDGVVVLSIPMNIENNPYNTIGIQYGKKIIFNF